VHTPRIGGYLYRINPLGLYGRVGLRLQGKQFACQRSGSLRCPVAESAGSIVCPDRAASLTDPPRRRLLRWARAAMAGPPPVGMARPTSVFMQGSIASRPKCGYHESDPVPWLPYDFRRHDLVDSLTTKPEHAVAAAPPGPTTVDSTRRSIRIALAALWTLVILFLCWMPGQWIREAEQGSPWFEIPDLDKVVHWGIFVLFAALWLRTGSSRWRYAWVALGGLAMASITELVQNLPAIGRDAEVGDAITDLIGVAIGLVVARWIEPLLRRAESLLFRAHAP
jgi:hypothetical protein